MLNCCNRNFKPEFSYIAINADNHYLRYDFGICPVCEVPRFVVYESIWNEERQIEKTREYINADAINRLKKFKAKLNNTKYGSNQNEHFYFGEFSKKNDTEYNVYRTNFNGKKELIDVSKLVTVGS